jgi:hypothetical protein
MRVAEAAEARLLEGELARLAELLEWAPKLPEAA